MLNHPKRSTSHARQLVARGKLGRARGVLEAMEFCGEADAASFQCLIDIQGLQMDVPACLETYRRGLRHGYHQLGLVHFYFSIVPLLKPGAILDNAVTILADVLERYADVHDFTRFSLARLYATQGRLDKAVATNQGIFGAAARGPESFREPSFIVAGTVKCGTTAFHEYLSRHPGVRVAPFKEVRFFNDENTFALGRDWYLSCFPQEEGLVTGEATPGYFADPNCPARIRELAPGAKIFLCLRDPVDRAVSHHHMDLREGRTQDSLSEMLRKAKQIVPRPGFSPDALCRLPYALSDSFYVHHLSGWLRHIPRSQVQIIRTSELLRDPQAVLDRAFAFLGLPGMKVETTLRSNVGHYTESDAARAELREYLQPFNQGLEELLGGPLD